MHACMYVCMYVIMAFVLVIQDDKDYVLVNNFYDGSKFFIVIVVTM